MSATTEITLRAMRFHALVGILPHEKTHAQPIEIDLVAMVGEGKDVVDYRRLYEATAGVVAAGHIDYLETIAERVTAAAFDTSDRIIRVRVAVKKPHVALGGPVGAVEVRTERLRPQAGV
jgi:dihydroneopterin aldolase